MKRHPTSELKSVSTKLKESASLNRISAKELKRFIINASDEEMHKSAFSVNHLLAMIYSGTALVIERILTFHPKLANQHGESGKTPLMAVLRQKRHKYLDLNLIKKLLRYGANPFLREIEHLKSGALLTPIELISQMMQNPNCVRTELEKCQECKKLFEAHEKKIESPTCQDSIPDLNQILDQQVTLEIQRFYELELMQPQFFENLLDQSTLPLLESALVELDSSKQEQFCEKDIEPDFFNVLPPLIPSDSQTTQNKNESLAQRCTPPKVKSNLYKFIAEASDEKVKSTDFSVDDLLTMIRSGTIMVVEKILKFHPQLVNQYGKYGTPLMFALRQTKNDSSFCLNLVKKLLQYGANPLLTERETQEYSLTPMEFVTQTIPNLDRMGGLYKKYIKCRESFEIYGKIFESPIPQKNVFNLNQIFDPKTLLVLPNPELKESPAQKYTPSRKRGELKKYIVQASDEMMQNTDFGVEHIIAMLHAGSTATVEKILKFHQGLVNQHCQAGKTPLMVALRQTNLNLNLIKRLLYHGANPFLREIKQRQTDASLTPMELVLQIMQRPDCVKGKLIKCLECKRLFEAYEKSFELQACQKAILEDQTFDPQTMLKIQGVSELELTQELENLLNQPECDSSEQGQYGEKNLEPVFFSAYPHLISRDTKTAQNKNILTVSTDSLEPVKKKQRLI